MEIVGGILDTVLFVYILILFARFVIDWVMVLARDWRPHGPVLVVVEVLYSVTDPPIKAVRKILPPIRLGAMMLDLSPLVVLVICLLLRALVRIVFFG